MKNWAMNNRQQADKTKNCSGLSTGRTNRMRHIRIGNARKPSKHLLQVLDNTSRKPKREDGRHSMTTSCMTLSQLHIEKFTPLNSQMHRMRKMTIL